MNIKLVDKIIAIFLYTIPLSDALPFGYYLFYKYSFTLIIQIPAIPYSIIERSLPFGGLLFNILIYLTIIKNNYMSNFLRFNALQSLLISIGIITISFIFIPFENSLIKRTLSSSFFIVVCSTFFYCIYMVALGKLPQILFLSNFKLNIG